MVPPNRLASPGATPKARRARKERHRARRAEKWSGGGRKWGLAGRSLGLAALAACLGVLPVLGGCCLVRPPDAKTLVAAGTAGLRTPEATFETFRVAFGADLPELEYRCFSRDFRRREGVSYQSYRVARQKLLDENPLLALLSRAEVVESVEVASGRRHRLGVQAAGRGFSVDLVREDRYQIFAGTEFLADGPVDFDRAVAFRASPGGMRAIIELLIPEDDLAGVDLSRATSVVLEETWKIDRIGESPLP